MIRKYKGKLIVTSAVILLPLAIGLLLWERLPDSMVIHWGADGTADGWSHKAWAVCGLPLFMLAMQWLCVLVTAADPKSKTVGSKPLGLVLWICPVMSLLCGSLIYAVALGADVNVGLVLPLFLGTLFVVFGNYLPKCRQNGTIGIRLPWTLRDEENWNRTHRFAGVVWVIGGVVMLTTAVLQSPVIPLAVFAVIVIAPTGYSYGYARKKQKK